MIRSGQLIWRVECSWVVLLNIPEWLKWQRRICTRCCLWIGSYESYVMECLRKAFVWEERVAENLGRFLWTWFTRIANGLSYLETLFGFSLFFQNGHQCHRLAGWIACTRDQHFEQNSNRVLTEGLLWRQSRDDPKKQNESRRKRNSNILEFWRGRKIKIRR